MKIIVTLTEEELALLPPRVHCKKPQKIPTAQEAINQLGLHTLGKYVLCMEQYVKRGPVTRLALAAQGRLLGTLVQKVIALGSATRLPDLFSRAVCARIIGLAGDLVGPEQRSYFRIIPEPTAGDARSRIECDILSCVVHDGMTSQNALRAAHMTDRLGILYLIMAAVKGDGFEYAVDNTLVTIGKGNKERGTNANHCSGLTCLKRRTVGAAEAAWSRSFLADWFLFLTMNRTNELPRADNEVDMAIEPTMRRVMVREVNQVAQGESLETCFERAVLDIKRIVRNLVVEWTGVESRAVKLSGLKQQARGLRVLMAANRVDREYYRMMGRLIGSDDAGLQARLSAVTWVELTEEERSAVEDGLRSQIQDHSARPFLQKCSPTLLQRLTQDQAIA